ncbi:MAG: ATP-binding protein, partial [Candidatus Margulisiibacteriota bacterium]
MFNIGASLSYLMLLQKTLYLFILICGFFVSRFAFEKFKYKLPWITAIFAVFLTYIAYLLLTSYVNLAYRFDVIEPAIESPAITPIRIFWVGIWLFLGVNYLVRSLRVSDQKEKNLDYLCGFSAIMVSAAYVLTFFYITLGESAYLLISWLATLFAFSGFLLGNIILPTDDLALKPLNFLRTKILFKLVLIFIVLIVVIVEATTLATIAISRASLLKAIIETDNQVALGVADKVNYYLEKEKDMADLLAKLQNSVEEMSYFQSRIIYIVDSSGRIAAHPDKKRALEREDMKELPYVLKALSGHSIGGDFTDKNGDRMVGSFIPIKKLGWAVVVSESASQAYFEIRKVETNSLIFVIMGILIAVTGGLFFAKSIEASISEVITGTEAIRKGNLNYKIKIGSLDEIGRLAGAFNKMTAELKETQDHLISSEKLAALGTMSAGMAHEIKNPLVALRTFTQLIPLKWEDKDFRDKFTAIVPVEIEKINKIAENLLKFGRPSKPEFKPTNPNAVLEEVLDLLENQFRKNNIRITTKFAKLPEINADPSQLSQAFLNIILNASQAMANGGELIIKTDIGEVIKLGKITKGGFISIKKDKIEQSENTIPTVFIEISDSGSGIKEEDLKNVFDPFYTTKSSGTGMGLTIPLRII